MPELDGLGATRAIRARGDAESQPWIIAMTAYAMEGDEHACREAGMDDYLPKPVRPKDLAVRLQTAHHALDAPACGVGPTRSSRLPTIAARIDRATD